MNPLTDSTPERQTAYRVALLNGLPDGDVTAWLLSHLPPIDVTELRSKQLGHAPWSSWLPLPRANVSNELMQIVVDSAHSMEHAEFLACMLHASTSKRAAKRLHSLRTHVTSRKHVSVDVRGYVEHVPASREIAGSTAIDYLARVFAGSIRTRGIKAVTARDEAQLRDTQWADVFTGNVGTGEALLRNVAAAASTGPLTWHYLGDDPAAWALAFELLSGTDLTIVEALETAAATVPGGRPKAAELPTTKQWRRRKPAVLTYRGEPVVDLEDPAVFETTRVEPLGNVAP